MHGQGDVGRRMMHFGLHDGLLPNSHGILRDARGRCIAWENSERRLISNRCFPGAWVVPLVSAASLIE